MKAFLLSLLLWPTCVLGVCHQSITGTAPEAYVGVPYSWTPTIQACGKFETYGLQHIPAWVHLNTRTGQITGTPSTTATTSVTYWMGNTAVHDTFNLVVGLKTVPTGSATVTLTPPTLNTDGSALTDLSGMTIYYGTNPASLVNTLPLPNQVTPTSRTISGLLPGTWYFGATAQASDGQSSALSAVKSKTIQ